MTAVKTRESLSEELVANPAARLFQQQWLTYRKMVDNNYLFHREAYQCLHRVLVDEVAAPFRFLDVACGDSSASVTALKGAQVTRYHGVDLSQAALQIAEVNLEALDCHSDLHEADFAEALRNWNEPVDIVWIGLSLHHFPVREKLDLMRQACRIVGETGMLLLYENASPDGEEREGWLRRWDLQQPQWTAFTREEWDLVASHVHGNDIPETCSAWHQLGRDAGFGHARELFVAPTDLFRLYCFRV